MQPRVAFLSAEVAPFAKVGGLGDVAGSLPPALHRRGVEIVVLLPRYGSIRLAEHNLELLHGSLVVRAAGREERFSVYRGQLAHGTPVLLLDHPGLFGEPTVYIDQQDRERFTFFCKAAPGMLDAAGMNVNLYHANDWHTAVSLLEQHDVARVFTIHNMAHQGIIDVDYAAYLGIPTGPLLEVEQTGRYPGKLNLMARAIVAADLVSTVSPRYAREIMTPEYGAGLDGLLRSRADDVLGILNGIDVETYDPSNDPAIAAHYHLDDLAGKAINKAALQRELGLDDDPDTPLVGIVSRLDDQKGFDLILAGIERALALGVQFAVLGTGAPEYHAAFARLNVEHAGRFAARLAFDVGLAQRIYAGSDMFLMPSRFEPCGLGQMIAMRYGSVPVVRATGGLADTVSEEGEQPNGFTFSDYSVDALIDALARAVAAYSERAHWWQIVANGMRRDVSWNRAAGEYLAMYRRVLAKRAAGAISATG